ncbi:MAG: hypothetical protein U5L96_10410 [Owenweeksia sp.]|nr:hypothetical protein [Owenweeksia sp.]
MMTAALPAGLKLESETIVLQNQLEKVDDDNLNDHEFFDHRSLWAGRMP